MESSSKQQDEKQKLLIIVYAFVTHYVFRFRGVSRRWSEIGGWGGGDSCEGGMVMTELCSGNLIVHTSLNCSRGEIHPTRPAFVGRWTKRAKSGWDKPTARKRVLLENLTVV